MSRKSYTQEFKLAAVRRITEQKLTQSSVARELGISESMVNRWVKQYEGKGEEAFPGSGKLTPAQQEVRQLQREVRELTTERDILKKAISYFAQVGK